MGPVLGELDRHLDVEGGLGQQPVALLDHDVVLETEILGRDEARGDAAGLVGLRGRDPITDRREFAAVISATVTFQLPFTVLQTS